MPRRDQAADNSHARFMRAVNEELSKFEYSEREFRRKDRDKRAKRLQMPAQKFDNADRRKTFRILVVEPEDIPQGNALPLGQDGRGFESGERYLRTPDRFSPNLWCPWLSLRTQTVIAPSAPIRRRQLPPRLRLLPDRSPQAMGIHGFRQNLP